MLTGHSSSTWEDLQKKARLLENEIDSKLIGLNKINSSGNGLMQQQNQLAYGKRTLFDSTTSEIETQITKLAKVIDEMREYVEVNAAMTNRNSLNHMLKRHSDLLTDYSSEFSRASMNIRNQLDRDELFEANTRDSDTDPLLNNRVRSTDYLLRENESIKSCENLLNEQISIAMSVKENVYGQGSGLGSINRRIHQVTKKYPALNSLMQKIRFKKRKDTIVLAAVISTCLIILFLLIMR